jgi:hypothetical protein
MKALVLAALLAAACSHDPAIDALHDLKEQACACRDAPCADRVLAELGKRQADLRESKQPDKARRLGEEVIDCLARAQQPVPTDAAPPDAVP